MLKRYRELFGAGTIAIYNVCTVSSMISSVSPRLLSIPSEKCHYFCHRLACVLRFAKNNLYCRNIHAKCSTAGWLLLGNPVSSSHLASAFLGSWGLVTGRAIWQPYSVLWNLEHTDVINPMELKDTARHLQYPASRVVTMGVSLQEAGKPPDTLGKWCNAPFSGGNSLLNPSSNELLAWSLSLDCTSSINVKL